MHDRARIVLLAASGTGSRAIAREVGCTPGTASKWRVRFAAERMAGLSETGDRGAELKYGPEHGKRIFAVLDQPPPAGYSNWTAPLLADELVDIHDQYIWRFLRSQKIDLSGRKSWCQSTDPDFVPKAAEIVGLYMNPPDNAVVLSVDEKPSNQALERAQGYLKLPNGRRGWKFELLAPYLNPAALTASSAGSSTGAADAPQPGGRRRGGERPARVSSRWCPTPNRSSTSRATRRREPLRRAGRNVVGTGKARRDQNRQGRARCHGTGRPLRHGYVQCVRPSEPALLARRHL